MNAPRGSESRKPRPGLARAIVQGVFAFFATIFLLQQFMSFAAGEATVFGALFGAAASWATLLLLYAITMWIVQAVQSKPASQNHRPKGRD
jgi:hypothetical protein